MTPIKLTNRNTILTEPWGKDPDHPADFDLNIGIIQSTKHNFLVDTGRGSGSVALVLDYLHNTKKPLIVINTHADWDHYWGNHLFAEHQIIAHQSCREALEQHWDKVWQQLAHKADGTVKKCLPNVTFTDRMDFHEDGVSIFHTPGHTPTCISVYDSVDRVLYAGDNIGDTDDEILPVINTDLETFGTLIQTYKGIDFDICVSGHNKPQDYSVVARMEEAWLRLKSKA